MNRFSRPVLEKKYLELRQARDELKIKNAELLKEINKLNIQVNKLQKDLIEITYLLDVKDLLGENKK